MDWHQAFLNQARSDQEIRGRLNSWEIPDCHRLHYLQMVCEKLAKTYLVEPGAPDPPPTIHNAFVRLLQILKGRPEFQRRLGYNDVRVFRRFIDSLLLLARRIEQLAPSSAGFSQPNPEYPWRDPVSEMIIAPTDFSFSLFDPRDPKMIRLEHLILALFRLSS